MALSQEDLQALAGLIDSKIEAAKADMAPAAPAPEVNAEAQNQPENQPDYYVHLADGSVFVTKDSGSSHMENPDTGKTEQVIGRYAVGA